jgi:Na+-transporting NADH:ubiquinone oxidoreductase subunit B
MKTPGRNKGWRHQYKELVTRFAGQGSGSVTGATHARSPTNTDALILLFILASLPAMLVTAWNAGAQMLILDPQGGRVELLNSMGISISSGDLQGVLVLGLTYIVPLLLVAGLVSLFWAALFAKMRNKSIDAGWSMSPWIYVLLVPADLSLMLAGLGMSFAAVLGLHIFGGTGRYIASPAALGALFVHFSYPGSGQVSSGASWDAAVLALATAGEADGVVSQITRSMPPDGVIPMALACFVGAAILARAGATSWRLLAGAVFGVALAAMVASMFSESPIANLGWHWHLALGSLPICLAFVITDPTTSSLSREGRWAHGLLFALFVVAIRVLDPTHPEGSLFAVLLATLAVPLIDYFAVRRHVARAAGQLELRT